MKGSLKEILKELGWDTGFRIPIANDENKQLEREVEEKTLKKNKLYENFENTEKRIELIEQHIKNIKVEHKHNQKLLTAYIAQYDAENHFHKISEHETSAIIQHTRALEKEKKNNEERVNLMKVELKKLEDKLNSAKDIVAIDQSAFLQWQEYLNRDEEDQKLIKTYMKIDRKKLKQLDLRKQKLTMELENHKQLIIKIMNDICEKEIFLESTSKFYVQALEERGEMINRWTQSVHVLRQRDNNIQKLLREIDTLREISVEKVKMLTESTQFMDSQCNFNKQLENSIKKLEKKLGLLKEERLKITENTGIDNIELKTRKRALNDLSEKTQTLRGEMKNIMAMNRSNQEKIDECKKQLNELKEMLNKINNHSLSIEERTKQLELLIESEIKRKHTIARETKRFQDLIVHVSSRISKFRNERKVIELQKKGILRKIELAAIFYVKQEKILMEKKDMIYQLNMQIRMQEIQLGKNDGIDNKAEVEQKQLMIDGLQDVLNDKKDISKLLQRQLSILEYEVKKVQATVNNEYEELENLKIKKQNLGVLIEGGEKGLRMAVCLNEERQVAENILELRVTQAEQMMRNTGDRVYNLERCRLQIHAAMKERMAEIRILYDAQNLKNKVSSNECLELRTVLTDKHTQIQNLKIKYDKIIASTGTNIMTNDNALPTTTYLKIQNAQEKFELQERGDKLDAKIRRTEQEIKSMENTLRIVNACNEKYKISLGTIEDDDTNEEVKQKLDEELCSSLDELRKMKNQLNEYEENFLASQKIHEVLMEKLKHIKDDKERKTRDIGMLERQTSEQKGRIMRADSRLRKLQNDIQQLYQSANYETIQLQQKDIANRELEEINLLGLQRLTEFTIRHVEAEVYVKKLLAERNISCPQHVRSSPSPSFDSPANSIASFNYRRRSKEIVAKHSGTRIRNVTPQFVLETVDVGKNSIPSEQSYSSKNASSSGRIRRSK